MKTYSINRKLREVLFYQDYGLNPQVYGFLNVRGHIGIDYSGGDNTAIKAYLGGDVVYAGKTDGTVVVLTLPDEEGICYEMSYGHVKDIAVNVGDRIETGHLLAYQDSTGPSTMWANDYERLAWSHIHFNVRLARRTIDKVVKNYQWNFQAHSPIGYEILEFDPTIEHFRDPKEYNRTVLETFCEGIAIFEGFTSGKSRIAVKNNNPGNLRYSPFMQRQEGGFAYFSDLDKGWAALKYDVALKARGNSKWLKKNGTILDFCKVYAPESDGNNPAAYAQFLVNHVGLNSVNDPLSDILLTEFAWLKKYRNNPFFGVTDPRLAAIGKTIKYLWSSLFGGKGR